MTSCFLRICRLFFLGVRRVFVHHVSYTFMLPASKSLARNVICTNSPRDCVQKQHRSSGTTFKAVASSWRQLLWKPHQLNRICCQSSELHSKIQRTIQKDILGGITSSPRLTSKNSSLMDCLLMHIPDAVRKLRLQAGGAIEDEGAFKLAVAVDGVNALWGKKSLRKEDRTMCESQRN
ncbi:28S ribosomal protein S29, mitochondrial isoform X1 [Carassius gibelio]|uniref:28S ribosomal protein S29, mitochondrial isoform X1 n=1 Tax=Carassius gibelio TaxID=101364 RepID=UPI0022775707|nr:28S ribosomal protein S29, mitochondrial isoform X1 [Carassius gibelio]